jgi:protein-disulfide isomerase
MKTKLKQFGIVFLLFISLGLVFVGCGKKQEVVNTNQPQIPEFSIPLKPGPYASAEKTLDNPAFGNSQAKLKIVMFVDFECPVCLEAFPIIRRLMLKYQDQVQFIFRDFPVLEIHPTAMIPARGGRCALEKGKFWEYHDRVFQEQIFDRDSLAVIAGQIGINNQEFLTCLDQNKYQGLIDQDIALVKSFGGTGTPTYIVNGYLIPGFLPYDNWVKVIDEFLAKAGPNAPN